MTDFCAAMLQEVQATCAAFGENSPECRAAWAQYNLFCGGGSSATAIDNPDRTFTPEQLEEGKKAIVMFTNAEEHLGILQGESACVALAERLRALYKLKT